jgi:hypothetical protein
MYARARTHIHVTMLKCAPNVVFLSVWPLQIASESCPILILEFSSVFAAPCSYIRVFFHQQPIDLLFAGVHSMYVTYNFNIHNSAILHFLIKNYSILLCLFFFIPNSTHIWVTEYKYVFFKHDRYQCIFHGPVTPQAFRPELNDTNTPCPPHICLNGPQICISDGAFCAVG